MFWLSGLISICQIKRIISIDMLSIKIDITKSLKIDYSPSVQQHQIVLRCKPYETEFSTMYI